jgi:hypothetical protein
MHLLGMQAGSLTSKAPLSKHHGNQGGGGRWPEAVSKTASATLHVMTSARFDSRINIYVFLIFGRKVGAGPMKKASDAHVDGGSPRAE